MHIHTKIRLYFSSCMVLPFSCQEYAKSRNFETITRLLALVMFTVYSAGLKYICGWLNLSPEHTRCQEILRSFQCQEFINYYTSLLKPFLFHHLKFLIFTQIFRDNSFHKIFFTVIFHRFFCEVQKMTDI